MSCNIGVLGIILLIAFTCVSCVGENERRVIRLKNSPIQIAEIESDTRQLYSIKGVEQIHTSKQLIDFLNNRLLRGHISDIVLTLKGKVLSNNEALVIKRLNNLSVKHGFNVVIVDPPTGTFDTGLPIDLNEENLKEIFD